MSTGKKIALWLLVSPFILIFIFSIVWDPNWFKGQAEPHLEDVEGHSIDFATINHSLFSPGHIEIQDITLNGVISNGKIGTLIVDLDVFDALNKDIYIKQITLKDTDLKIDMQAFNLWLENKAESEIDIQFEDQSNKSSDDEEQQLPLNSIYINKLSLENVNVQDSSELKQFSVSDLNLNLKDLNIAENAQIILGDERYPIDAQLDVTQLRAMSAPPARLHAELTATQNLLQLNSFTLNTDNSLLDAAATVKSPKDNADIKLVLNDSKILIAEFERLLHDIPELSNLPGLTAGELKFKGKLNTQGQFAEPHTLMNDLSSELALVLDTQNSLMDVNAQIDNANGLSDIKIQINESQLDLNEFQGLFTDIPVKPSGVVNLKALLSTNADLSTNGQVLEPDSMLASLSGKVQLAMDKGKLDGIDINELVTGFKDSKETDLKDVGSFLLTGPVGILAANLVDIGAGAAQLEGETLIQQLRVNGQIEDGSINLNNTAIATDEFRLAFDGAINPGKNVFEEFTFAILDEAGCADIRQTLDGEISNPTSAIAKSLLDSAIAPITGLLDTVKNAAVDCEPFYQGEVAAPR